MSLRYLMLMLALSGPGVLYAADLFTVLPAAQSDALRAAQDSSLARLKAQRTALSVAAVGVDVDALDAETLTIDLPTAHQLKVIRKKIEKRGPDDFTWYGEVPGTPGTATLVVRGKRITGTIRHDKDLYRIVSLGDGVHALVHINESAFPPDHPAHETVIDGGAIPPLAKAASAAAAPTIIDVLVTYTSAAESKAGDILGMIQLAVDESNQAYSNSNINLRLRLVHAYKTAGYSEKGKSFDTIKSQLANTNDSNFPEVHNLRNQYGADVVVGIIDQDDACGSADAIMATASTAFVVVHWDCATGYYSFSHEIGHLQGARHDPATDNSKQPFTYGHGYRFKQKWRTVMAYDCPKDCPRLQYFSNPDVIYGGKPMGTVDKSNNARVLNQTAATVAGFRPTAP